MDFMSKKFRVRVNNSCSSSRSGRRSCGKMATDSSDDNPIWPSIAGPSVPENNPKLWKTPRLDMSSSLSFLRRELAAMQLQDRGIHKQLLALNSVIRDLKTTLQESWENEDTLNQTPEDDVDGEALCSTNTQVSHTKQDSGILTDEESDEECDIFEPQDVVRPLRGRSQSTSAICISSGSYTGPELDINQNVKTSIKGRVITPRPRSHTVGEGQFHRVTSMPVINEIPGSTNFTFSGKAFAVSGYLNRPRSSHETSSPASLSRHGSMPVISNIGRTNVRHVRSETVPIHRGLHKTFSSTSQVNRTNKKPLYRIWRSSSQISLV